MGKFHLESVHLVPFHTIPTFLRKCFCIIYLLVFSSAGKAMFRLSFCLLVIFFKPNTIAHTTVKCLGNVKL